jgi:glycosyltransferase involved in cell wall biosynthesis
MQATAKGIPTPLVSVGLPVFNGETFLSRTLDSILNQTWTDFELIISDNASTDATPDIVRAYAARDPRIRCFRQNVNIGIGNNWSFVARMARGKLLKWVSANDEYEPRLVEQCVSVLQKDPTVVLCYSRTQFIDEASNRLDVYFGDFAALSDDPIERYRIVRRRLHLSTPILSGVIRLDAVRRCGDTPNYRESDRVLTAGLALFGKFVLLPEVLAYRRWSRSVATPLRTSLEIERMYRPDAQRPSLFPTLRRQLGQLRIALVAPRDWRTKLRCLVAAFRCTDWRAKFMLSSFRGFPEAER